MTSWQEMRPVQFDASLTKGKAREFVRTAGETMFPDILPEPERKTTATPAQLQGQAALFEEGQ